MVLLSKPVSSKLFTHVPDTKSLVTEISTLQRDFQPLYDDAADIGLILRNNKTGNLTAWYVSDTVYDNDGDIVAWQLKPTWESIRANWIVEGYTMLVVND